MEGSHVPLRGQTGTSGGHREVAAHGLMRVQPLMQAVQGRAHAVSRERVDIGGLGLLEELGNVGGGDGVAVEARFESLQPERRQHQQPRDQRHQQPRHKDEVNTAKVSAGSRIVTGPHRRCPTPSVRWHS
jgi:hypothetical protein